MILIPLNVTEQMFMISFQSYEKIKVMHISTTSSMPFKLNIVNLKTKNKRVRQPNSISKPIKNIQSLITTIYLIMKYKRWRFR